MELSLWAFRCEFDVIYLYVCVNVGEKERESVCFAFIFSYLRGWVLGKFDEKLESVIFNILHLGFGSAICVPWQADGQKCSLCSSWNRTLFPCGSDTKLIVMCLQVMDCKWQPVTVSQNVNHTVLKQSIQISLGTPYISDLGMCLYVYVCVCVYIYIYIYIYINTIFKAQSYYVFFYLT